MMNNGPHFFGLGQGRPNQAVREQIDAIAERHGASFTCTKQPGDNGPRFWFECPNQGEPFDGATAKAVFEDLEKAGLADVLWPGGRRAR